MAAHQTPKRNYKWNNAVQVVTSKPNHVSQNNPGLVTNTFCVSFLWTINDSLLTIDLSLYIASEKQNQTFYNDH